MAEKPKKQYEGMFLLPAAAAGDADGAISTVRSLIERHHGEVIVIKKWDERKLAYEIAGQKRGLYVIAYFTAPGAAVAAIERDVNLGEGILRVLITDADHMNKDEMEAVEPQPIQPREERQSWDRPYEDRGPRRDDRGPRRDERGPREERAAAEPAARE